MAAGVYKNGVAIIVTYQAVNCATGKTVTMDVYDEAHAKDVPKCVAAMTEIGTEGRYYATFTPDAEGEWIIIMENTTDSNGKVVKSFAVAGHDVDAIGDAVAVIDGEVEAIDTVVDAIKAVTDVESGVKADVAVIDGEIATIDTVVDAIKTVTDVESGTKAAVAVIDGEIETVDTVVDGIQTDLSNATDGLGAIKDAVDAVSSPAMVG